MLSKIKNLFKSGLSDKAFMAICLLLFVLVACWTIYRWSTQESDAEDSLTENIRLRQELDDKIFQDSLRMQTIRMRDFMLADCNKVYETSMAQKEKEYEASKLKLKKLYEKNPTAPAADADQLLRDLADLYDSARTR